jgi:hypothetical protein
MFIAPAAIFGGFFIWLYGGPLDLVVAADRFLLKGMHSVVSLCSAAIEAISKLVG